MTGKILEDSSFRGVRFAPSPTGTFHVGNLRTGWVSWKLARTLGEPWIVRFEDIDGPRSVPGARQKQLEDLARLDCVPDEVVIQSESHAIHEKIFKRAVTDGQVYPCLCSRKEVQEELALLASAPNFGPQLLSVPGRSTSATYSGHCRRHPPSLGDVRASKLSGVAWRFKMTDPSGLSDFVIARTRPDGGDFQPAYHWACGLDDAIGGYRLLVRAVDLEHAAPLQRAIGVYAASAGFAPKLSLPGLFHTRLVVTDDGHRLEKRTRGVTLDELLNEGWTVERLLERFESTFAFANVEMTEAEARVRDPLPLSELLKR